MKFIRIIACIAFIFALFKTPYIAEYFRYNTYTNDFDAIEYIVYKNTGLIDKGNLAFKFACMGILSVITIIVTEIIQFRNKQIEILKQSNNTQTPPQE